MVTVTVWFVPVASYNQKAMRPATNGPWPITIVNTVPPGLTVSCLPKAQGLAEMDTVALLPAVSSVPDDGETFT